MEAKLAELTIEITQKCPNECLFCSSLAGCKSEARLEVRDICRAGVEAASLGLREVSLSGGEPLCHPDVKSITTGLHEAGLGVNLYTTGLILRNNTAIPFQDWDIFGRDLTKVVFNIQSTLDSVHDRLVGRAGALSLTHRALSAALQAGMEVEVHVVPNLANLASIATSVKELAGWGVRRISFLRMVYQGYARSHLDELYLDKAHRQELRDVLYALSQNAPAGLALRFGIPFSADVHNVKHCTAGDRKLIVRYDGKVLPCEAFKDADDEAFVLGDIRADTLESMLRRGATNTKLCNLRRKTGTSEPCPAQLLQKVL